MNIIQTMKLAANRGILKLRKYSPEILTGLAVVSGIAATATAIERTLKLDDVLAEIEHDNEKLEQMAQYKEEGVVSEEQYSDEELTQARVVYGAKASLKIVYHYRLPIALTGLSVASIFGAYHISKARYAGVVAAYTAVQEAFDNYREEVRERIGEEEEKGTFAASTERLEKKVEEAKKLEENEEKRWNYHGRSMSMYARWFDEASRFWKPTPGANALFVRRQEKYWNDVLRSRGHVFLNEVYDSLDIDHTSAGAVVGWIYQPGAEHQIDFGLLDGSIDVYRDFINGRERSVLLDFNVDGVIYDLI